MSQTNIIAGCAIIAFIIFITVKGELPAYLGFLTGAANTGTSQTASNSSGINLSAVTSTVTSIAGMIG